MTRLQQLKTEFTTITGLSAKKVFVEAVCSDLGARTMRSIKDWEWAVTSIQPRFVLADKEPVAESPTPPEPTTPVFNCVEDIAQVLDEEDAAVFFQFLFAISADTKNTYRQLCKRYHPDVNPGVASHLIVVLNRVYEEVEETITFEADDTSDDWQEPGMCTF